MSPYVTPDILPDKTNEWMKLVAPFNTHNLKLNIDKSALMVIDMQKFFLDPQSPTYTCGGPVILPKVKLLTEAFRSVGRPVIYTKHVHHPDRIDAGIMGWWWDGMCIENSPESEIADEIAPNPSEKIIFKHRYSAFYDTDLETVLRCLKIEDVVVSGIMTNMCCESTARDAYYRDYRVFFPADATGSITEEMHTASLLNLAFGFAQICTTENLLASIPQSRQTIV